MNKTGDQRGKDVVNGLKQSSQSRRARQAQWALLQTLRDLRRSIAAGRPMSLPNCRRLCSRRLQQEGPGNETALRRLTVFYRSYQPFDQTLPLELIKSHLSGSN